MNERICRKDRAVRRSSEGDSWRIVARDENGLNPVEISDVTAAGCVAVHDDSHELRACVQSMKVEEPAFSEWAGTDLDAGVITTDDKEDLEDEIARLRGSAV